MLVNNEFRDAVKASVSHFLINDNFMMLWIQTPECKTPSSLHDDFFSVLRISLERDRNGIV